MEGELICSENIVKLVLATLYVEGPKLTCLASAEPSSFELVSGICIANNHPVIVFSTCQRLQDTHQELFCEGQVFNRQAANSVWNLVPSGNCAHIFNVILNYGDLSIIILKVRLFFSLEHFRNISNSSLKLFNRKSSFNHCYSLVFLSNYPLGQESKQN